MTTWATVTSADPLKVTKDGESVELTVAFTLVDGLAVGDLVRIDRDAHGRVIVLGRSGGVPLPSASTSQAGVVELATSAETQAGTDTGLAVTPAGLASVLAMHRQLDTTDGVIVPMFQSGIGKITGNGNANASEAVTFPVAFSVVPNVQANLIGVRATGAFNPAGLSANDTTLVTPGEPSTSGFTARIRNVTGTLSSSFDYYYSWIAIGPR